MNVPEPGAKPDGKDSEQVYSIKTMFFFICLCHVNKFIDYQYITEH